jgi:archaeal flagellar protein FlaH
MPQEFRSDIDQATNTIISSQNMELDSKMGGGLPVGCLTLVEGVSGSGKSVLSQQMTFGALKDSYRVSLFTSENTVRSLMKQMASIDLDVLDFLLLGKLRVYPIELSSQREHATASLLEALRDQADRDLLIVDSFTSVIAHGDIDSRVINFFEECKRICAKKVTIIVTLHSDVISDELIGTVRSLCDANLRLHVQQDGQRMVKTLEVAKIQGASGVTGAVVGFEVEPGWGMRVIPISKARG